MLKLKKIILVFLCLLPFTAPAMAESTGMNFPVTTLKAGKHLIRAEVASTEAQRECSGENCRKTMACFSFLTGLLVRACG